MEKKSSSQWGIEYAHLRSQSEYMQKKNFSELNIIKEEEEWCSSENKSVLSKKLIPKKQFMKRHCRLYNEEPKLSEDPSVAIFQSFFMKIQKHLNVYDYLISSAISSNILNECTCTPASYYYKHIHFSNNSKFKNPSSSLYKTPEPSYTSSNKSYSTFTETSEESHHIYQNNNIKLLEFLNTTRQNLISIESKVSVSTRKGKITAKRVVLDRSKPKLIKIYQTMCNSPQTLLKACRLTNPLFKQYLQHFFSQEMAEAFARFFDFKSANFEDFCTEMDRFLLAPEDKLLCMCFDVFDLNRDKYICYQDAFAAIAGRKENYYDSDLVKLKTMMDMKKKGITPLKRSTSRKGRRMSVMSISSEMSIFSEKNKKKEVPHVHPDKPEALTLEDFLRIEFKGKPQVLRNFFLLTCNYDIDKFHEVVTPIYKSRKQSEDMVVEISQSPEDQLLENVNYEHLRDLENSMNLFKFAITKDLLQKYDLLRDRTYHEYRQISKSSMVANWPKLFGAKCDYVSERFFYFFCGVRNKCVTKSRFLKKISKVVEDELKMKRFSFTIYDARRDKKITTDEASKMEEAIPANTPIHSECLQ